MQGTEAPYKSLLYLRKCILALNVEQIQMFGFSKVKNGLVCTKPSQKNGNTKTTTTAAEETVTHTYTRTMNINQSKQFVLSIL